VLRTPLSVAPACQHLARCKCFFRHLLSLWSSVFLTSLFTTSLSLQLSESDIYLSSPV
jgi:hypothetical protein